MSLVDRLERLEQECALLRRQGRRWRAFGLTLAVLAIAGAWQAQDVVKTQRLEIVDKDGKARIVLTAEKDPQMTFLGKENFPRLLFGLGGGPVPSEEPYLNFRDAKADPRLVMGLTAPDTLTGKVPGPEIGSPYLGLRDAAGKPQFLAK